MRLLSNIERDFIRKNEKLRTDGRRSMEGREISVDIHTNEVNGQTRCEVTMGESVCYANVSVSVVQPYMDRPNEGLIVVNTIFPQSHSTDPENKIIAKENARIATILEHVTRDCRAIDAESLCIVSGKKVWSLRCDIFILNDSGNVLDCAAMAAMGALTSFRKPDVLVSGENVTIFELQDREPVPLSVHHVPLCCTFALFSVSKAHQHQQQHQNQEIDDDNESMPIRNFAFMDPTDREELAQDGTITIVSNIHGEICGVYKNGWPALSSEEFSELVGKAVKRCSTLEKCIRDRD